MKRNTFLIFPMLVILATGCGGYHSKQYSGPKLDKAQVSTITTGDQFVTIGGVDGKKINLKDSSIFLNAVMWGARFPRTITVLPGKHSIWPCYQNPYESGCAEGWLFIETEAGKSYIVNYERLKDDGIKYKFKIDNQDENDKTRHQKLLGL